MVVVLGSGAGGVGLTVRVGVMGAVGVSVGVATAPES